MKKVYYFLFKKKVFVRAVDIADKQDKRLTNLIVIRKDMISSDRFYFDMPFYNQVAYRRVLKLDDNEATTKLLIRLTAPVYSNIDRLKTFAKEFPL